MAESRVRRELAQIDDGLARQRKAAASALETLLLRYPIPDAHSLLQIEIEGGERYDARLRRSSDLGLTWSTVLGVPSDHLMAASLRVDRALEKFGLPKLILHTPGDKGVFRKRVKWVPRRLGKEYIAGLTRSDESTRIQLREGPSLEQPGFDIAIQGARPRVMVKPVGRDDEAEAFEAEPEDARALAAFARALTSSAEQLKNHQSSVADLRLEGEPYATYAEPTELVRRLLDVMAPVVREIAKRSAGQDELVLKRVVGEDRREEIFVSFQELRPALVDDLPEGEISSISAGGDNTCAAVEGEVRCWGDNDRGAVGTGDSAGNEVPAPARVPNLTGVQRIAAGGDTTCAIAGDERAVFCWGDNDHGQTGADLATSLSTRPVRVAGIDGVVDVDVGRRHGCAVGEDGAMWCWGSDIDGRRATGRPLISIEPSPACE